MDPNYPIQNEQQPLTRPEYVDVGPQPNLLLIGILALVINAVFAIVLGALGRKMGREYVAKGGQLTGAAKVGFVFCKVALILGIVSTTLLALFLIFYVFNR